VAVKLIPLRNPIRAFAVLCVAITTVFVMVMSYRLIQILASPEWCGKALQAERISSQNFGGLTACVDLLKIQLKALATNSFIFGGVIALCLLTLIVIVIAGGKISVDASMEGVKADISREPVPVEVQNTSDKPVPVEPSQ
jgi:hypothetical protein